MLDSLYNLINPPKRFIVELTTQDTDSGNWQTTRHEYSAEVWQKLKPIYDKHFSYVAIPIR